jgi:hypothetical protein
MWWRLARENGAIFQALAIAFDSSAIPKLEIELNPYQLPTLLDIG